MCKLSLLPAGSVGTTIKLADVVVRRSTVRVIPEVVPSLDTFVGLLQE